MKTLVKVLKKIFSPLPLIMIVSLIVAAVVYFYGSRIGMRGIYPFSSSNVRFWTAMGLLALSAVLFLVIVIRAIAAWRKSKEPRAKREPTEEERELAAFDSYFTAVIKTIRANWTGKGKSVYGLPWYMVLGDHGAGKTSFIDGSGLRFPIDHEIKAETRDYQGTQAASVVNFRVAGKEAILLELNADYFTHHDAQSQAQKLLWTQLGKNLIKVRARRPINGIVLMFDMVEFMTMSSEERDVFAVSTRRTINDLIEQLGTQMTIHIVFSKMDLIAGFDDYFENLNVNERESLFGFHFLKKGKNTPDWLSQFDTQYASFIENVQLQLKKRIIDLKTPESRAEAFAFFRSLSGLQEPLHDFFQTALSADFFTTPPLVRGIYMGSHCQENAARNVFHEAIGQRYGFLAPLYGVPKRASFPFFSAKIFKEAILPEAGLAGNNQRAEGAHRRRFWLTAAVSAVAVLASSGFWYNRFNVNLAQAEAVLAQSTNFTADEKGQGTDFTGQQYLAQLDQIRQATFEFGNYREVTPIMASLTLYQGSRIGPITDTAYSKVLHDQFGAELRDGVAQALRDICPKGSDKELDLLRVYRMLGTLNGRDPRVIEQYFRTLWQREFESDAPRQAALASHLDYMLNAVPVAYELDENLVREAQSNITKMSPYRRIYASLRALADSQMPNALELDTAVGASFDMTYQVATNRVESTAQDEAAPADGCGLVTERRFDRGAFEIPRFMTKSAYYDFFIPQNERVASIVAKDLWVLGRLESSNYSEADLEVIKGKVRENYVDDYIRVWRQSLNAMQMRDFTDIRDATEILRAASGADMPIRRVAQLIEQETVIVDDQTVLLEGTEAPSSTLPVNPDKVAGAQINDAFREIRALFDEQVEGSATNVDQIQEALVTLYDYMKVIRDAPSMNGKALEEAINRIELREEDPIYVLQRLSERAPAPFDQHLRHIADESWRVIMVAATDELNRKWHEEIYGAYSRLIAGKYPFDRSSSTDLPVDDFVEFFAPSGILDNFYRNELLIFVDAATGTPKVVDGQSLAVDKDFSKNLKAAINITNNYFNADGELSVEFAVSPEKLSPNLSRAILNFEGQIINNTHGPSRPITIVWPNIIDGPKSSRIDLSPLLGEGRATGTQIDGAWSWLRLYDRAGKSSISENAVDIVFSNAAGQQAVFKIRPTSEVNVFFNSPLSDFSLPSRLRTAEN